MFKSRITTLTLDVIGTLLLYIFVMSRIDRSSDALSIGLIILATSVVVFKLVYYVKMMRKIRSGEEERFHK
ncbi:hypothetical protein [Guptibacillus algicola]|uniref:hypothetical protein n=1 Tax=Guptibacillus algicola TaxID=225844 RepID=UPI001CD5E9F1|nr:hypothetical protein [Alkalihalobacillus algicola]MCA0987446.1 hypothetical protein [Alkalihalobacillus algicola]